jgi:hypothetical protein
MNGLWAILLVESIFNTWTIPTNNLMDLNNIYMDETSLLGSTIEPIDVIQGHSYTLVIDEPVIGQHFTYLDEYPVKIIQNYETLSYPMRVDWSKQVFYIEFVASDRSIELENLPLEFQSNYNVMLYEGLYSEFKHFFPFHESPRIETFVIPYDIVDESHYDLLNTSEFGITSNTIKVFDDRLYTTDRSHVVFNILGEALWYEFILVGLDSLKPTFDAINIERTTPFDNEEELLNLLNIQDNVTSFENLSIEWITPFDAINQEGTHQVIIHLKDEANNLLVIDVTLTMVLDQIPPVIDGPSSIYIYTNESSMTDDMILSRYIATDNKAIETFVISSNQYAQTKIPGVYQVVLKATDIQKLSITKTIMIHVINNEQTLQSLPSWMVTLTIYETMTDDDIKSFIESHLIDQGLSTSGLLINSQNFKLNASNPGIYEINYQTEEVIGTVQVEVLSTLESVSVIVYVLIGSFIVIGGTSIYIMKRKKVKR